MSKLKNIKSSKLSFSKANALKKEKLYSFLQEYKKAVKFYVDCLFYNKIYYSIEDRVIEFCIKEDKLDCPQFIITKDILFKTNLSQRALKCASTQACGIIKSIIKQRKKYLYVRRILQKENKRTRHITKLINDTPIIYPKLNNVNVELNSLCCKFTETKNLKCFNGVITLSSLGKDYGKIIIPLKYTKHSKKLSNKGNLLNSFLISNKGICFRYEIKYPELKKEGVVVGADQGIKTCVSMSDKQVTKPCIHGHDLDSIVKKLSMKKYGSKAFYQAKDHKINYINWSINQLNFLNIKELKLEKINNFRNGKNVGKYLNNFGENLIKGKLQDIALQNGVRFVEQSASYRSQRCSKCGYVSRKNRKGKLFSCKRCSFQTDADYNASCNHEQDLPSSEFLRFLVSKPKEFFWKEKGFFDLQGQELTVPGTQKEKDIKL